MARKYSDWAIKKLAARRERTGGYFTNPVVEGDPEAIYSPGVVGHEAGHAKLHTIPVLGDMLTYAPIVAPMIAGGIAARGAGPNEAAQQAAAQKAVEKLSPYLTGTRLADEAGSSLISLSNLKKDVEAGKMSKEDYAAAQRGLLSAFGTYGVGAATQHKLIDPGAAGALGMAATAGTLLSERGGMTAEQAAKKVHEIAPGTDVYAINAPIGGGSMYIPKARTPLGGLAHRALFAAVLPQKEITRLSERGGIVTAPVHLGTAGVGIAQSMANQISPLGPLTPMLTYPGEIRKGRRVIVPELEEQKGDVLDPEKAYRLAEGGAGDKLRAAAYSFRHPLAMAGQVLKGGPKDKGRKEAPPKEELPKEKAASASPHVQYLRMMLTEA